MRLTLKKIKTFCVEPRIMKQNTFYFVNFFSRIRYSVLNNRILFFCGLLIVVIYSTVHTCTVASRQHIKYTLREYFGKVAAFCQIVSKKSNKFAENCLDFSQLPNGFDFPPFLWYSPLTKLFYGLVFKEQFHIIVW